jgi:hypothetical protein
MYFNGIIKIFTISAASAVRTQLMTVISVKTRNDSTQIGSYCDISIPLNSTIKYADGGELTALSKTILTQGDKVEVYGQYTTYEDSQVDQNQNIDQYPELILFDGFILDLFEGNPTLIKCVDYFYNLNMVPPISLILNDSIKNCVDLILEGTGITQMAGTFDFKIVNMPILNMTPAAILDHLKKELGINISLIGNQLFVNIASTTINTVKLDTSVNVIESNISRQTTTFQKYRVKAWFLKEDHTKDSFETGDEGGQLKEVFFYKVPNTNPIIIQTLDGSKQIPQAYYDLATSALAKYKMNSYNGTVKTKMYPMIEIFDLVVYNDVRYPDRSGTYVCTGRDGEFDPKGFNWTYKLAYLRQNAN